MSANNCGRRWPAVEPWRRVRDVLAPLVMQNAGAQPRLQPLTWVVLLLSALHVAVFFAFAPATQVLRPYSDMFDLLDAYFHAEETGAWLSYLFQPHSYHRLPLFRSLIAFDVAVLKGTGIPLLFSALLSLGGIGLILVRQAFASPATVFRLSAAAFAVAILLTTGNVIHLGVPANTPYAHALFFALLAIVLAEPGDGGTKPAITWRRLGALLAACAAVLSLAAGAVVWVILAFMALRKGEMDRRWLIVVLAVGGAFFTAYVHGLALEGSAGSLSLASLVKAGDYLLAYLGLPWTRATPAGGRIVGAMMLVVSIVAIARRSGPSASRHERILVSLVLFSLGTAVLAALGRQNLSGEVAVPGRYNLFLVPMKVGLVLLVLPWLEARWRSHRRWTEVGVVLVFLACLTQQVLVGRIVAASAEQLRQTITEFQLGARTEPMKQLIHPDLERAQSLQNQIQARGLFTARGGAWPPRPPSACAAPARLPCP